MPERHLLLRLKLEVQLLLAVAEQPNLTYLLTFENMEARDQHWAKFRADSEWTKLRDNPYYADTVSNITDIILRPTAYSQI